MNPREAKTAGPGTGLGEICEPCTYLPAVEADSTPTLSLDTPLSPPSSGTPTPVPSSGAGPLTAGFLGCGCTRETPGCSTHPNTPAEWIASMRDSLALIFQQPVEARESTANAPDFIGRSSDAPMLYDPASSSWKTPQLSLVEDLGRFSGTWPSAGMMQGGRAWPLPRSAPTMSACGGGVWLTPRATDIGKGEKSETFVKRMGDRTANCFQSLAAQVQKWPTPSAGNFNASESLENWTARRERVKAEKKNGNGFGMPLGIAVRMWPTPTVDGNYNRKGASSTSGDGLATAVGGSLNPTWVAWLMGWPLEATKLGPLETARFPSARLSRGSFLAVLKCSLAEGPALPEQSPSPRQSPGAHP